AGGGRLAAVAGAVAVGAVVVRIGLVAAGLRETARDEVAGPEDRDVQPRVTGDELIRPVVAALDQSSADEDAGDERDHAPELGGLERALGLVIALGQGAKARGPRRVDAGTAGGTGGGHV